MNMTKQPSQRQLRVGEQLRHIIIETLQRGHFQNEALFETAPMITVSEVRISPDLKNATAYVSLLGGRGLDDVLPALNDVAAYFQREINHKLKLKFTPRLRFVTDHSFDEAQKIENILRTIRTGGSASPDTETPDTETPDANTPETDTTETYTTDINSTAKGTSETG